MAKKVIKPVEVVATETDIEQPSSTAVAIIEPITEKPTFIDLIKFDKKDASIKIIKDKSAEYAKVTIDGVEDKVNYALVVANMGQMRDDRRTFENTAYANVIDPLKKALKEYADDIDLVVEEFKTAEKLERDKKDFIDEEKKRIKKEKEEAKVKAAQARVNDLIVLGAKFDGQLYTFDYDSGILINSLQLLDFDDAEFGEFLEEVKTAFADEQTRLHELKLQEEADEVERLAEIERNKELAEKNKEQEKELTEKRIKLRVKELKLNGLDVDDNGIWIKGGTPFEVESSAIAEMPDAAWDDLISDIENYVEPERINPLTPDEVYAVPEFAKEFEEGAVASDVALGDHVNSFADQFVREEPAEIEYIDLITEVTLTFDWDQPFTDFDISGKLLMRLYPDEYRAEAVDGIDIVANQGQVQGLNWLILSKSQVIVSK